MKIITNIFYWIFFLTINSVFGQTEIESLPKLVGKQLTGDITYNDSIKFIVQIKADTITCYQISLEKKINSNWTIYTNDVFNPSSKDIVICAPTKSQNRYSFLIDYPELFELTKNGTLRVVKKDKYKVGLFRLKINYGKSYDNLSEVLNLPEFRIGEPNKKK